LDISYDVFEVRNDGIYLGESRIVAQYHFGPGSPNTTTTGGYRDMQDAWKYNVTVYHIGNEFVYYYRAGIKGFHNFVS